jgi:phenylacetate-CoA ligase
MGLVEVYHRLPTVAQNAAISAYGLWLRQLRYGGAHPDELERLLQSHRFGRAQIVQLSNARLFEMMRHAVCHVPFYRDQGLPLPGSPRDARVVLKEWPILEKRTVQERARELISETASRRRLHEVQTGGTTGRPLAIRATTDVLRLNYAYFERLKRIAGIGPRDRVATFAGRTLVPSDQMLPPFWRRNVIARQLLLSSYHISESSVDSYIDALERFSPRLIDSYPSSLELIAKRILARGGAAVRPVAVITSSETLFPEVRAIIEAAFQCKVFDHYGSAEMVAFISECPASRYHVNEEFGHLELLDSDGHDVIDGEEGEIVATGYINSAMPLIRYRMGDRATRTGIPCDCGWNTMCIGEITGRVDDVILTPDGRRVGRIDPIFKSQASIQEARIIQDAIEEIRVELVVSAAFSEQEQEELVRQLRLRLGTVIEIKVSIVDAIARTKRGKLRMVQSSVVGAPNASP